MGGGTALELAVHHPERLLSVVPISASVRPEGSHPDLDDPSTYATSTRMPTEQDFADMAAAYAAVAPHPERFDDLPARSMTSLNGWTGWTDEQLAGITAPMLIVVGDHDFTTTAHAAVMQELIPGSQLAVLPGTTHMQATAPRRPARADARRVPRLNRGRRPVTSQPPPGWIGSPTSRGCAAASWTRARISGNDIATSWAAVVDTVPPSTSTSPSR